MSKIFISGASGVIGKELVKILIKKNTLFLGDLKPCPNEFLNKVRYYQGDLNKINPILINEFKPDIFIHLAASFERLTESVDHIDDNFNNNTALSLKLLKIFTNQKTFKLKKFIFASSYLTYQNVYSKKSLNILSENSNICPRNLTGLSKLMHENEIKLFMKGHDLQYYILRIFRGYGKGSRDIISRWINNSLNNKINYISNPNNSFDFIYSKDTSKVIEKILTNKAKNKSGTYNLGSGKSYSINHISEILKKKIPNAIFKKNNNKYENERSISDNSKLEKNFNLKIESDIEKNIDEIINYQKTYKNNSKNYNILLTCIGNKKNILEYLIESSKNFGQKINIYISDSNKNNFLFKFYDKNIYLPLLKYSNLSKIQNTLLKNKINLIIPTGNEELIFWSKFKKQFTKLKISIALPDYKRIIKFNDKYIFYNTYKNKFNVIPTFYNPNSINNKYLVAKKRFGSGSKNLLLKISPSESNKLFLKTKDYIFQEFIKGYELSVDAYFSKKGELIGFFARKREFIENGESKYSTLVTDKILNKEIKKILNKLDIFGPIVMQIIVDKYNNLNVIEVNTRVGGATGFSITKGLRIYDYLIQEYLFNRQLNKNSFISNQTNEIFKFTKDFFS